MTAMVTIVIFSAAREPFIALPHMTPVTDCMNNSHPPVIYAEYDKAKHPFDKYPDDIIYSKQYSPQTAMTTPGIRKLYSGTSAARAPMIHPHFPPPICLRSHPAYAILWRKAERMRV